jgi:hypothetical protein
MRKLINLFLLIVISFSVAHGVVLDTHQDEHCSVQEYVAEFSHPISHDIEEHDGDLCNSHFLLHISFLLPSIFSLVEVEKVAYIQPFHSKLNHYNYHKNTFRPPIS